MKMHRRKLNKLATREARRARANMLRVAGCALDECAMVRSGIEVMLQDFAERAARMALPARAVRIPRSAGGGVAIVDANGTKHRHASDARRRWDDTWEKGKADGE